MRIFRTLLSCLLLLGMVSSNAHAQSDPFFKGKQIKIIVGFTAGGIVDLWARLFIQYMGKYIPGNPDVIVQNVPGGGSMFDRYTLSALFKEADAGFGAGSDLKAFTQKVLPSLEKHKATAQTLAAPAAAH